VAPPGCRSFRFSTPFCRFTIEIAEVSGYGECGRRSARGYRGCKLNAHWNIRLFTIGVAAFAAIAGTASGQTVQRRASIAGGGSPDRGRCSIEVTVDGAAEVEIRGSNATLRNLSGQAPQWRRFECTGVIPPNPPNFRFTGVNGRGSQELVRGPQDGGVTVVRIQDTEGGADSYTFELTWGGGGRGNPYDQGRGGMEGGRDQRGGQRVTTDEAVRVCQDAVKQQAFDRFHSGNIAFRTTVLDNNPGRQDWVAGMLDIRRGYGRDETYNFSCSVNFETGQVRSAQIDTIDPDRNRPGPGDAGRSVSSVAMDSCRRAVEDRAGRDGYQHVDFLSIRVDDRPGRNDWIVGTVRADVRLRSVSLGFSCSVNLQDGDVRSVDVRRQ